MKKILISLVCLAVLVLALGIGGCSEGPSDDSQAAASEEGSAEVSVEEGSEASFSDKFKDFVSMKTGLEYTVSYDFSSKGMGQTDTYTMTQYFGGKNRMRMDSEIEGHAARVIMDGSAIYSCNKESGAWQCMKFDTGDEMEDSTEQFRMVEDNPDEYDITYAGTMKIAGATAHCYAVSVAGAELKECFSKEGIPLYMLMKSSGFESEMKATTYKASVKDSDFDLPAEPIDMEQMMQQAMANMPEGYDVPDMN